MEAARSVAGRVTPLHGASDAPLGRLEQPTCDAKAAEAAARAEDRAERQPQMLGAVADATGLEQALQDKVQQQAAQLQQQAALLRDALRHGELCEARLLAAAATAAATAATAAIAGTAAAVSASARPLLGAAGSEAAARRVSSRASSPKRCPPPRPVSGEAAVRRELRDINGRHAALLRTHAATEERLNEMQAVLRALRATHDVVTKDFAASQARAARLSAAGGGGGAGAGAGVGAGAGAGAGGSAGDAVQIGASTESGSGSGSGGLVSSTTVGGAGATNETSLVSSLRVERSQLQQALYLGRYT